MELLLLHRDMVACLEQLKRPVFVITHRSNREAKQILSCTGIDQSCIYHIFAANEILYCAIKWGRWRSLIRCGLKKSFILPELHHKYGIGPSQLCFVDDRPSNIRDMTRAGTGLCLLAPEVCHTLNSLTTFNFQEIVDRFRGWRESIEKSSDVGGLVFELAARQQAVEDWCRTGVSTKRTSRSTFNAARRLGRRIRESLRPT